MPSHVRRVLCVSLAALACLGVTAGAAQASMITVTKSPSDTIGRVVDDVGAIDCGSDCVGNYQPQTVVTLSALPAPGWVFKEWQGDCSGSGGCTPQVLNAHVTAVYEVERTPPTVTATPQLTADGRIGAGAKLQAATSADESGIYDVEYLVNDQSVGRSMFGPTWDVPFDAKGYKDGQTIQIIARATDGFSNVGTSAPVTAVVDTTAGAAFIDPSPAPDTIARAEALTYAISREHSAVCWLDGTKVADPCDGPFEVRPASEGEHTVRIIARDEFNATEYSRKLYVDRTAPSLVLKAEATTYPYGASVTVPFTASDASPVTVRCGVDDAAAGPCSSGTGHTMSGLPSGRHVLTVIASDRAGNTETRVASFTIAAAPPQVTSPATSLAPPQVTSQPVPPTGVQHPSETTTQHLTAIRAAVKARWGRTRKGTRVRALTVTGVPAGGTVVLTCRGRGCPSSKRITVKAGASGRVTLTSRFRKRVLAPGATMTVHVAANGWLAKTVQYRVRAGRSPKSTKTVASA